MATDPFDDIGPEVAALFAAARETEPVSENPALFAAMADAAASGRPIPQTPHKRRTTVLGKILTAKAAAVTGALLLSGGVAAATESLPDPLQDAASDAAGVVGVDIPKSNHGAKVSSVARDKSNDGEENHGKTVSSVARDNHGQNKKNATTTTTVAGEEDDEVVGPGNSRGAGKSEDSSASDNARGRGGNGGAEDDDDSTTTTTLEVEDDDETNETEEGASESGKGRGGKSGKN